MRDVEWDACVLEPHHDPELEAYVRRAFGIVPPAVPYFTGSAWLVRSMASLSYHGAPLVHLDYELADLVSLVVSQDSSCRYCYGMQRTVMRVHGLPERRIQQIAQNFLEAEIEPRTKLALELARRIARAAPVVSGADARALAAAGFGAPAIRELAFQAAYCVFMNRLMTMAAIPVESVERMAEHWSIGWLAPIARLVMRRHWRRAEATTLAPEQRVGPFSYLVHALDGLPAAPALRVTLDAMWESPLLSKRAKALAFAVVARGLESAPAEHEARALLEATGVAAAEIEPILTHLASPTLDPVESAIVPFARGTIRGRPTQLQQRTRTLREALRADEVVETVGVCALANAVCRLDFLTQLR